MLPPIVVSSYKFFRQGNIDFIVQAYMTDCQSLSDFIEEQFVSDDDTSDFGKRDFEMQYSPPELAYIS